MKTRRELIDTAMRALKSSNDDALEWSKQIAEDYREATGPQGVYNRAGTFKELRQRLRKEAKDARDLAQYVNAATVAVEVAITHSPRVKNPAEVDQQKIDDVVWRRHKLVRDLEQFADNTDKLIAEPIWPKGGDWDLAKAHLGSPKQWLVGRCLKVFFRYGNIEGIRTLSAKHGSPFGDYVRAIYELATGDEPDKKGVGLDKIIDNTAHTWRRNERRKILP
jgi:hypothetical protein